MPDSRADRAGGADHSNKLPDESLTVGKVDLRPVVPAAVYVSLADLSPVVRDVIEAALFYGRFDKGWDRLKRTASELAMDVENGSNLRLASERAAGSGGSRSGADEGGLSTILTERASFWSTLATDGNDLIAPIPDDLVKRLGLKVGMRVHIVLKTGGLANEAGPE